MCWFLRQNGISSKEEQFDALILETEAGIEEKKKLSEESEKELKALEEELQELEQQTFLQIIVERNRGLF